MLKSSTLSWMIGASPFSTADAEAHGEERARRTEETSPSGPETIGQRHDEYLVIFHILALTIY